mgnify:FL=1
MVVIRRMLEEPDRAELTAISDGRAIFHESSYDPVRIWGWIDREGGTETKPSFGSSAANCENSLVVVVELNRSVQL